MILGVTGCPGSGKSVLASVIAECGWTLVDADRLGKTVVEDDPDMLGELARIFGEDILGPDGRLDRRLLSRRAFATPDATRQLNRTVHPHLIRRLVEIICSHRDAGRNAVVDCALIFEWDIGDRFDRVICVRAEERIRRNRLFQRDHRSPEEIDRLFAAQLPEAEKAFRSQITITNNGGREDLVALGLLFADLPNTTERARKWMAKLPENGNG